MVRATAAFVTLVCLAFPAAAEPPPDHGLAQKIHEFYQDFGGTTHPFQQWGLTFRTRGPITAEEAQRLREIVDDFYRQAADARTAADFANVSALVPVHDTLMLAGEAERSITIRGRLLEREVAPFSALVERLRAEMPQVAPASVTEPPAPEAAVVRRLMKEVAKFHAEVAQRVIDVHVRQQEEESFHLCSICDITLESCLDRSSEIVDDCILDVGDFRFCSDLYFDLNRTCHYEHINCTVAFCS